MQAVLDALAKVRKALGITTAHLAALRLRWKHWHDAGAKAHRKAVKHSELADQYRKEGKPKRAAYQDGLAVKASARVRKAQHKCLLLVGKIKPLNQRLKGLKQTEAQLLAKKNELQGQVTVNGDTVSGGTKAKRLQTAMLTSAAKCSSGKRSNFYSQTGAWDVSHCITGEARSHRSDCSSWFTSVYHSCGLSDPNGQGFGGGYTGTLAAHGRNITRNAASQTPGAAVLFGSFPCHHVEMSVGNGTEHTIGHGSPPVDMGTFDLLPGPVQFRAYY